MKVFSLNMLDELKKSVKEADQLIQTNFTLNNQFKITLSGNDTLVYANKYFKLMNK